MPSRDPGDTIREGYDVFVHDGEAKIGAVRHTDARHIRVYVENAGDFEVPRTAVRDVEAGKVVLDCSRLDMGLRRAIGHAHDAEDPAVIAGRRPVDPAD